MAISTVVNRRTLLTSSAAVAVVPLLTQRNIVVGNAQAAELNPQPLPPSPNWRRAMPSGPETRGRVTEAYARLVARDAYFWAWPLVNMYNRRLAFSQVKDFMWAGPVPSAPLNHVAMLTDYITPDQRHVACPNQDVVYGAGFLALDLSPVVVQVPDFGERFWVYQILDTRTDSFATVGKMYGTRPGFYLLVGPDWNGDVPHGITQVFRASTNSGFIGPRVFLDDTPEDRQAIQDVLKQIMAYPLADYDGVVKTKDWASLPHTPDAGGGGDAETQWVFPDKFVDELEAVLQDAPALPGEEARYAQALAVLGAAQADASLKAAMTAAANEADTDLVRPLFEFRNYGIPLPSNWSTIANGAMFGTDYLTRTAVAKSNMLVNAPVQAKYFYQDLDVAGGRLNGGNSYTVTFAKDQTPPVNGFWSLTLYNEHHFFAPNDLKRYSLGTKNKALLPNDDGSLTLLVQAAPPAQQTNWLPAPKDADFSLFMRAYWPKPAVLEGSWTPPPVERVA